MTEPRIEVYQDADRYALAVCWQEPTGSTTVFRYGFRTRWFPRALGGIIWALNIGRVEGK